MAAETNRRRKIKASTVKAYVDPHACHLVDAINTSVFRARTRSCCSGHYHKPGLPYVAFRCWGWDFVRFILTAITALNRVTQSQTSLYLSRLCADKEIWGSVRLSIYPWLLRGMLFTPLLIEEANPPRSLVRLWWRELDELAAMIEERRTWPSREFVAFFDEQWRSSFDGRRRPKPAWARPPDYGLMRRPME